MDASHGASRCQRASAYYYDLLHPEGGPVPPAVRRHVAGCPFCQGRMRRLSELVVESQREPSLATARSDEQTIAALRVHFERIDEPVTCAQVKPLFAGLLARASRIRIPTPVTVHIDRCPPCARDLAALRAFHLRADQLERLTRLYGASGGGSPARCRQARSALAALASLSAERLDAGILRHISTCAPCREELYRLRGCLPDTDRRATAARAALACDDVATADLFDFVVPHGAAADAPAGRAEALAAHVRSCPRCVERLQALHRTIYGIVARPDSGVVTVYDAVEGVRTVSVKTGDGACWDPAGRQVRPRERAASGGDSAAVPAAVSGCRGAGLDRRSFVKIALAAVVFSVLSVRLFTNAPTASGTSVGEVLQALEEAPNIHMMALGRQSAEPVQEIWVARALHLLVVKTGGRCVLYDFQRGRKRVMDPDRAAAAPTELTEEEYEGGQGIVASCVGGLLATVSRGSELYSVASTAGAPQGPVVYELTAETRGYRGSALPHRVRVWVDPATRLPQRIEFYRREPHVNEWQLTNARVFEYLTEQGMRNVIEALLPPE